jgi:hypothetical protein
MKVALVRVPQSLHVVAARLSDDRPAHSIKRTKQLHSLHQGATPGPPPQQLAGGWITLRDIALAVLVGRRLWRTCAST